MKFILVFVLSALCLSGQDVQLSGNIHYTYSHGHHLGLNNNTNADNPFNPLRAKLFVFSPVTETMEIDLEVVFDDGARNGRQIWLHGAQVKFNEVLDSYLNIKLGKIPMNIGQFVNRIDESVNGVIGVPLMYSYQTLVDWEQVWDTKSQLILKQKRGKDGFINHSEFPTASPIAYESCWNTGIEFFGSIKSFHYSLGFSNESLTNPKKYDTDDLQVSGRIGYQVTNWLNIGVSAARSRYLSTGINLIETERIDNFYHTLVGIDGSIETQTLKIFGEAFISTWDNYSQNDKLKASTGFLELNWLFPFSNNFEFVSRFDVLQFDTFKMNGASVWWDADLYRYEAGFKYGLNKRTILKSVYQYWDYQPAVIDDSGFFAVQCLVLF